MFHWSLIFRSPLTATCAERCFAYFTCHFRRRLAQAWGASATALVSRLAGRSALYTQQTGPGAQRRNSCSRVAPLLPAERRQRCRRQWPGRDKVVYLQDSDASRPGSAYSPRTQSPVFYAASIVVWWPCNTHKHRNKTRTHSKTTAEDTATETWLDYLFGTFQTNCSCHYQQYNA